MSLQSVHVNSIAVHGTPMNEHNIDGSRTFSRDVFIHVKHFCLENKIKSSVSLNNRALSLSLHEKQRQPHHTLLLKMAGKSCTQVTNNQSIMV